MSTVNAVEVIAEALAKHTHVGSRLVSTGQAVNIADELDGYRFRIACRCGWFTLVRVTQAERPESERDFGTIHAAHQASVIAALPNIAILPRKDIVRIYRAASTLGQQYMMPTHFGADREEAERWFGLQQKVLDGLPGIDTVRLEYQDMWVTKWEPLDVASVAGGEQ